MQGQTVWLILHKFELFRLKHSPTEEAVSRMELFYQQRLCEPHLQLAETHQLFSTFVSTFKDASYEESLVSAQPLYNATKAVIEIREPEEDRLSRANSSLEAFQAYLSWEQEVKKPSFQIVRVLHLRALARFPLDPTLWHGYLSLAVSLLPPHYLLDQLIYLSSVSLEKSDVYTTRVGRRGRKLMDPRFPYRSLPDRNPLSSLLWRGSLFGHSRNGACRAMRSHSTGECPN
jgi:hypothetical protein